MTRPPRFFRPIRASLRDLTSADYIEAVCAARAALTGESRSALRARALEKVEFFPPAFQRRLIALLPRIGQSACPPLRRTAAGAASAAYHAVTRTASAPLSGYGYYRIGEDGRLAFLLKSEHYHAALGHAFPAYRLLDLARRLGIPNATHNNTRGFIARRLEEELVRAAHGLPDRAALHRRRVTTLNRVINLETGSLVAEAALKLVMSRFHRIQPDSPTPRYRGRVPVLLVIGNDDGGLQANYHGTTIVGQMLRGMWPDWAAAQARRGLLQVHPIRPNAAAELDDAFRRFERPPHKIAGFFHELIMMNYGARRMKESFLRHAYTLCRRHDVPTVVDEIQSCLWSPTIFQFREYGLKPDIVAAGKGFSGGEFAAARILFCGALDTLPQFGALVTNGQEELASLAYLITLRWAEANADRTRAVGEYYETRLRAWAKRRPDLIAAIEGERHLAGIVFRDLEQAKQFATRLSDAGLDISVQTYKSSCPPCALTKLPLIVGPDAVDAVLDRLDAALVTCDPPHLRVGP